MKKKNTPTGTDTQSKAMKLLLKHASEAKSRTRYKNVEKYLLRRKL
jgi:hypothetical protein